MRITALHTAVVEGNYGWTFVRIDTDSEGLGSSTQPRRRAHVRREGEPFFDED